MKWIPPFPCAIIAEFRSGVGGEQAKAITESRTGCAYYRQHRPFGWRVSRERARLFRSKPSSIYHSVVRSPSNTTSFSITTWVLLNLDPNCCKNRRYQWDRANTKAISKRVHTLLYITSLGHSGVQNKIPIPPNLISPYQLRKTGSVWMSESTSTQKEGRWRKRREI